MKKRKVKRIGRNHRRIAVTLWLSMMAAGYLYIKLNWSKITTNSLFADVDVYSDKYLNPIVIGCLVVIGINIVCMILVNQKEFYISQKMSEVDQMTGEEFEKFIGYHYENLGYKTYTTNASNDYGADLVIKKGSETLVVQAKRYRSKVGIAAVQQVIGAISYYHADGGIVVTNSLFTEQAKALAKEARIQLLDRYDIQRLTKRKEIKI